MCVSEREQEKRKYKCVDGSCWTDIKAAGYIHPLDRSSTWMGWIVEDSEAAGVAIAPLRVHQF